MRAGWASTTDLWPSRRRRLLSAQSGLPDASPIPAHLLPRSASVDAAKIVVASVSPVDTPHTAPGSDVARLPLRGNRMLFFALMRDEYLKGRVPAIHIDRKAALKGALADIGEACRKPCSLGGCKNGTRGARSRLRHAHDAPTVTPRILMGCYFHDEMSLPEYGI